MDRGSASAVQSYSAQCSLGDSIAMSFFNHVDADYSFDILPFELKELVWYYSMPGEVSEVALLPGGLRPIIPLGPRPDDSAEHSLVIYTAYPVLMHVCREWREFAKAQIMFRYSQTARMDVPTRPFQPEMDILYIPAMESNPIWHSGDNRCMVTRHIAMQPQTFLNYGARSLALMTYFKNMETLTIVLPSIKGRHSLHTTFSPPTGRCQLQRIADALINDVTVLAVVQERGPEAQGLGHIAPVSTFLNWVETVVQRTVQYLRATQEWDPARQGGQGQSAHVIHVKALAQTFVKHHYENGLNH